VKPFSVLPLGHDVTGRHLSALDALGDAVLLIFAALVHFVVSIVLRVGVAFVLKGSPLLFGHSFGVRQHARRKRVFVGQGSAPPVARIGKISTFPQK
jgi:hypothetical protein